MLLNNKLSKKNNKLYKMKYINTRNMEYFDESNIIKIEKNNIKIDKYK